MVLKCNGAIADFNIKPNTLMAVSNLVTTKLVAMGAFLDF